MNEENPIAPVPRKGHEFVEVELVFESWYKDGQSITGQPLGIELSLNSLHSGTVFRGLLELDSIDNADLTQALQEGVDAIFSVRLKVK